MSIKSELIAARARIDTPEKWGKGGNIGPAMNRNCAATAIAWCSQSRLKEIEAALDHLRKFLPAWASAISTFNDDPRTTHSDVMSLFDRAIEEAV